MGVASHDSLEVFRSIFRRLASAAARADGAEEADSVLALVADAIGEGLVVADETGTLLYANAAAKRLFPTLDSFVSALEWARSPGVYLPDMETPYPADRHPLVLALGGTAAESVQLYAIMRGGRGRSIEMSGRPISVRSGRRLGALAIFRDVSARRAAEAELRDITALLDAIVENMPDMLFVKESQNLSFERVNRAAEQLMGFPRRELLGRTDHDFFPREDAEFFQSKDRETLASGRLVDIPEERIQTPLGVRWLHTKKVPIRDASGRPTHLLGISSDITEEKSAKEALQRARQELELRVEQRTAELRREIAEHEKTEDALRASQQQLLHAQKMEAIGRLAGGIAHDFNNLLSVILSYSSLVMRDLASEDPVRADLHEINRAAQRAAALTRGLLAFSRQQVLEPRPTDLNVIVRGLEQMLRRVIGEDIALEVRLADGLAPVTVDPGQIEQVVMNLVVNARDAMPRGGSLVIETANVAPCTLGEARDGDPPDDCVLLEVRDTGTGMDEQTRARLFEPFFTTKEQGKGTGLGLSIVFGIVHQSGGTISVESEPGRGSAFRIHLPRATREPDRPASLRTHAPDFRGSETILLVEDDHQLRELARTILLRQGYHVLDAASADQALAIAGEHGGTIHLLLADVVMPQMSGVELARRVAALRPGVKVLWMSGYAGEALVASGIEPAQRSFLPKPFTPDDLARRLRDVLDGTGARP